MITTVAKPRVHGTCSDFRLHHTCSIIGASLISEPLLDELAGAFLWYIYIYLYPWAVHLVPRGPPVNALRANVRPAE